MQNNAETVAGPSIHDLQSGQTIDLIRWLTAANDESSDTVNFLKDTVQQKLINGCREIHLEQEPDLCRLRCRSMGQLDEAKLHTDTLVPELIRTFSAMAGRHTPHPVEKIRHGEFAFNMVVSGNTYRVDATFYPTNNGTCLTLSLLSSKTIPETLDHTTLNESSRDWLRNHLSTTPQGLTLLCSPNSIPLQDIFYASLCELNSIERKTVSMEHVIHKNVSRITQLPQAGEKNSLAVARIASRHADNVLVDWKSAQNTQLISQLVSDHQPATVFLRATNASIGIRQLIDAGVNERQIAGSIATVIELADVPLICPHCGDTHTLSGRDMQWLDNHTVLCGKKIKDSFVRAPGCDRCNHTGIRYTQTLLSSCENSDALSTAVESRSCLKIQEALHLGQAEHSLPHQIETLARNGKTSFQEFKRR